MNTKQSNSEQTETETMQVQFTQVQNGEDAANDSQIKSEISSYNKPEDDRICKQCGYFGCLGSCV